MWINPAVWDDLLPWPVLRVVVFLKITSAAFEWLLDNECPYDWDVDEKSSNDETVTLIFSEDT